MKRFESGDLYQPAAQSQGFSPLQVPDITPLLRENQQARMQESQNIANAQLADLAMQEQALKYQALLEKETVGNLVKFSETLSNAAVKYAEKRNESEMERGLMLAYTNGVDPEASAEYDVQEAALEKGAAQINKAAGQFYQDGMPVDMVKQVQNLSGWAKYGYMKGLAEQAGQNYGSYYMQAAKEMKVMVPGREEPISLLEATTAPERAAVKTAIAQQYISQFRGMNPMLLNKYLFPKMKQWEQGDDLEFAKKQRDAFEADQKQEMKDGIFSAVNGDNAGVEFEKLLNRYEGLFGGMANAKEFAFTELGVLADAKLLTPHMVQQLKEQKIFNRATQTWQPMGEVFQTHFAKANLEARYNSAFSQGHKANISARDANLRQEWEALKAQYPDGYPEALEDAFKKKLLDTNQGGLGYTPKWFDEKNSLYDRSVQDDIDTITTMQARGIGITETDVRRLHPEAQSWVRQSGIKILSDENVLAVDSDTMRFVRKQAVLAANHRYDTNADNASHPSYGHFKRRFEEDFLREYMEELEADGDPKAAAKRALATVEAKAEKQVYDEPLDDNQTRTKNSDYATAKRAMSSGNSYATTKLPGLSTAIKQLENWVETGEGTLPTIFNALAYGKSGVSGWDIARHQYLLHTNSELARDLPSRDQAIKEREVEVQDLMNHYPTAGRNTRAFVIDSGGSFNDPAYLTANLAKTQPQGHVVRKFRAAIITQESGGRYHVLGQYVQGQGQAVGIGQVMPANIGPWTKKYYGQRLSSEEFRLNPAAQDAVINGKFNEMLTREFKRGSSMEVAVRRAAAEWYGGPGAVEHWNNPGFKGAFGDHPNMAEYTMSIWRKFQGIN